MAQLTRTQLYALVDANILTGGRRTTGEELREVIDAVIESLVSATDDDDTNLGYLKIDSSGKVDVTKIKKDTPTGQFLKDSGVWSDPDIIGAVLAGLSIAAGDVSASDTILEAMGKLQGKLPATVEVTGVSQVMTPYVRYIANNAGLVDMRLPTTAAVGDIFRVRGKGGGLWKVTQAAGQTIRTTAASTTTGTGGLIIAGGQYDCVDLECITANTDFVISNHVGTLVFT